VVIFEGASPAERVVGTLGQLGDVSTNQLSDIRKQDVGIHQWSTVSSTKRELDRFLPLDFDQDIF
jgi:hypothetical protein